MEVLTFRHLKLCKDVSFPLYWLSFSLSLVLFFYILYVVTHTHTHGVQHPNMILSLSNITGRPHMQRTLLLVNIEGTPAHAMDSSYVNTHSRTLAQCQNDFLSTINTRHRLHSKSRSRKAKAPFHGRQRPAKLTTTKGKQKEKQPIPKLAERNQRRTPRCPLELQTQARNTTQRNQTNTSTDRRNPKRKESK